MSKFLRAAILSCSFLPHLSAGPVEEIDLFIEKALKEWNVPGASISIVSDGKILLNKGYGISNAKTKAKVDENTIFQLASVTKSFTSAALGVLVAEGKLSWDEEVINHLPQFALKETYPSRYTTTRDLLAHRTGLPAFGGDLLGKIGYSNEEILRRARYVEPATSFRERAHYSNLGYFIAGELLSAMTGSSWEDSVQKTILDPLGMKRSGFASKLEGDNVAYGHILKNKNPVVVRWDLTGGFPAAGAMTSTASDMAKWMTMLLQKGTFGKERILEAETVMEMFSSSIVGEASFSETAPINKFSGFNYGMGWGNFHYMNRMIVEKGGGLDGIRTVVVLVPQENLGITILANLNLTLFPEAVRAKFLELFVGNDGSDIQAAIKLQGNELQKLLAKEEKPEKAPPPSLPLKAYTGTFSNDLYGKIEIFLENEQLFVKAGPAGFKGQFDHLGADVFILSWEVVNSGNENVSFVLDASGNTNLLLTETLGTFNRVNQ